MILSERVVACLLIVFVSSVFAACRPAAEKRYEVSGTVMWNGQPIKSGYVALYTPASGASDPDVGKIVDGKFTIQARPGFKRVGIQTTGEGRTVVPPSHNGPGSILTVHVSAAGTREFNFSLTEDAAGKSRREPQR